MLLLEKRAIEQSSHSALNPRGKFITLKYTNQSWEGGNSRWFVFNKQTIWFGIERPKHIPGRWLLPCSLSAGQLSMHIAPDGTQCGLQRRGLPLGYNYLAYLIEISDRSNLEIGLSLFSRAWTKGNLKSIRGKEETYFCPFGDKRCNTIG